MRLPHAPTLLTLIPLLTLLTSACTGPHPLRGGRAITTPIPSGGLAQTLTQGDNPAQTSRQAQHTIRTRTYTLPAGTPIVVPSSSSSSSIPFGPVPSTFNSLSPRSDAPTLLTLSAPLPVTDREETHASTELGAAQKDTARELGAKLASLKGIVWVGLALFVFGLASLFWPPLKIIVASVTTSAAISLGGIALMILPTLIVGHELLILGSVALSVGAWFLAHRHGHLRGQLQSSSPSSSSSIPSAGSSIRAVNRTNK